MSDKEQISTISDALPVQFNFYITCHLDCTFGGYKYVTNMKYFDFFVLGILCFNESELKPFEI